MSKVTARTAHIHRSRLGRPAERHRKGCSVVGNKIGARKTGTRATNVRCLTDYIRDPSQRGEKVLCSGSRGFLTDEHCARQAEMIALAEEAAAQPQIPGWRQQLLSDATSISFGSCALCGGPPSVSLASA
jgi:hypothetical protein